MYYARNAVIAFILLGFTVAHVWSFTLEPMTARLSAAGEKSVATFRVDNNETSKIAIRFRVVSRDLTVDGTETNAPVDSVFAVYPSSVIVEPGRFASVKIQWRGTSKPEREQCFRFIAEQVPVNADQGAGSGFRILFRYIASVYVSDGSFAPALSIEASPSLDSSGKPGIELVISNTGTQHVIAKDLSVDLSFGGGASYQIRTAELGALGNFNFLPGCAVRAYIPAREKLPGGPCTGRLTYESEQ